MQVACSYPTFPMAPPRNPTGQVKVKFDPPPKTASPSVRTTFIESPRFPANAHEVELLQRIDPDVVRSTISIVVSMPTLTETPITFPVGKQIMDTSPVALS